MSCSSAQMELLSPANQSTMISFLSLYEAWRRELYPSETASCIYQTVWSGKAEACRVCNVVSWLHLIDVESRRFGEGHLTSSEYVTLSHANLERSEVEHTQKA